MTDWTSPAAITGLWGALASTAAAVIAWRVFRWQRQSEQELVVTCELVSATDPDWLKLSLIVRNLSSVRWQFTELSFRPASAAKGISYEKGARRDAMGGRVFDAALGHANAGSPVKLIHRVEAAGVSRPYHGGGYGDATREEVFLERTSIRSAKLSMRLTLVSMEAVQRKTTITIVRNVPPPITAAVA